MFSVFEQAPISLLAVYAGLLGLMVGSFLNVVIYRFPIRMKHDWTVQAREWLELETESIDVPPGIVFPASHCGNCKTPIKAWHNIPIISYLILMGRCAACKAKISLRYPTVELITGLLSAAVVYKFGWTVQSLFGLVFTWVLVTLSFIDIDHQLLPDDIVLPTLWLGLTINLFDVYSDTTSSLVGAIAGYLVFWTVFQVFLKLTGKEGMGHGDFKLLALLGAWLGWQYLPQIVLISTLVGTVFGVAIMVRKQSGTNLAIPFGPYIALAGWIAFYFGTDINNWYLAYSGLQG